MCLKDIVTENESFQKRKRKRKVKIIGEKKKYRNHKEGWICDGLTGRILGGKKDFIKIFKKIIRKYHADIEFPDHIGAYRKEMNCAGYAMDDLIKRNCSNDAVVTEWMEWYAQVFLTNKKISDQKFLSIEYFRKTWKIFDTVRRKDILIVNSEKNNVINENSILFRINKIFNNDYSDKSIIKALRFFGVIITSNYMQSKFGKDYNIKDKINFVFEKN